MQAFDEGISIFRSGNLKSHWIIVVLDIQIKIQDGHHLIEWARYD
jgi:hypothetical protein